MQRVAAQGDNSFLVGEPQARSLWIGRAPSAKHVVGRGGTAQLPGCPPCSQCGVSGAWGNNDKNTAARTQRAVSLTRCLRKEALCKHFPIFVAARRHGKGKFPS